MLFTTTLVWTLDGLRSVKLHTHTHSTHAHTTNNTNTCLRGGFGSSSPPPPTPHPLLHLHRLLALGLNPGAQQPFGSGAPAFPDPSAPIPIAGGIPQPTAGAGPKAACRGHAAPGAAGEKWTWRERETGKTHRSKGGGGGGWRTEEEWIHYESNDNGHIMMAAWVLLEPAESTHSYRPGGWAVGGGGGGTVVSLCVFDVDKTSWGRISPSE